MYEKACHYSVFGLQVASSVDLPELVAGGGATDVTIQVAPVPERLVDPVVSGRFVQASPGRFRLEVPGVASFLATGGTDVSIALAPGAAPVHMRQFLYGSVLGAVLHQRGVLPLHASAVSDGERAILFAGESGHGKSTLAAAMIDAGYRLLADDVTAVRGMVASPAYPQLKLCSKGHGPLEKELITVPDRFVREPRPISHVYVLAPDEVDDIALRAASTAPDALNLLLEHTYRRTFLDGLGAREANFRACAALARHARVTTVLRPAGGCPIDELRQHIAEDLR
jgi:hypothetical protein